jgi:hypothetical protein
MRLKESRSSKIAGIIAAEEAKNTIKGEISEANLPNGKSPV